ncbi:MAG: hypothetical protein KDE14_07115 [Rhodobacteraceae bacterium]|nr:hypothetical protein [Paracoccaceae bacterium]
MFAMPRSLLLATTAVIGVSGSAAAEKQTVGLVLTEWHLATVETPDAKAECPDGFQWGNVDNWKALYPNQADQDEMHREHGFTQHRGKNGENVFVYPWTGHDPLPFREIANDVSYGADLDGVGSGEETPKTCKHENFNGIDGRENVDNQLYRVLGCQKALRRGGFYDARFSEEKKMRLMARWLVEITDVDSLENDDHVVINTYKGRDKLVADAAGNVLPWISQRVDERGPRFMQTTTGRIVDGVLYSDPVHLVFSTATHNLVGETDILDAQFELKLSETAAEGIIVGYHDLDAWWKQYTKQSMSREHVTPVSGPSVWEAAVRLADGHKDPATGQCTAISTAYEVKFTRAFIVREFDSPDVATAPDAAPSSGEHKRAAAESSPNAGGL